MTTAAAAPVDVRAVATGTGAARVTWRETKPGLRYRIDLRDGTEPWRVTDHLISL